MTDDETVLVSRNHNTVVTVYHLPTPDAPTDRPLCNRGANHWLVLSKAEAERRYAVDRVCEDCRLTDTGEPGYHHKQGPTTCKFCGNEVCAETHLPDHLTECPAFEQHRSPPEAGP